MQPALWERYQNQVKEWESAVSKAHNFSNGCKEGLPEKPPMFAFCLKPRGLEAPNNSKQRSQRRFIVLGHHSGVFGDSEGLQITGNSSALIYGRSNFIVTLLPVFLSFQILFLPAGRKLNGFVVGDEKGFVTDKSYSSSDVSPLLQTSTKLSPTDAVGPGILSMSSDWSERNQYSKLHWNKTKKVRMNPPPRSSQMASMEFNQRVMGMRNGAYRLNIGLSEWHSPKSCELDGFQRKNKSQSGGPDFDEFKLRDASGAAQHALNMAKLKRERANRLLIKADHALQKAVIALMTAEALKVSVKDSDGDG